MRDARRDCINARLLGVISMPASLKMNRRNCSNSSGPRSGPVRPNCVDRSMQSLNFLNGFIAKNIDLAGDESSPFHIIELLLIGGLDDGTEICHREGLAYIKQDGKFGIDGSNAFNEVAAYIDAESGGWVNVLPRYFQHLADGIQ